MNEHFSTDKLKPKPVLEGVPVFGGASVPPEDDDLGYCASRPVNKNGYHALGVKRNGKRDRVYEYSHLATSYAGDNTRLDLVFAGNQKWVVIVHGRNLLRLLYFIKERRIDWVREATGNAAKFPPDDDGKPFISKIELKPLKPEEDLPELED